MFAFSLLLNFYLSFSMTPSLYFASFSLFTATFYIQDKQLFCLQEVAVKKFLQQDLSGDALEEFRTEVYSSLDVIQLA